MYKLISFSESAMTRYVKLKNCKTGKNELCFDDSDVRCDSQDDFGFMKIGGLYECKILLFDGRILSTDLAEEDSVICKLVDKGIRVGNSEVAKVNSNGDEYYVAQKDLNGVEIGDRFAVKYSRKDLIQVNETILPRFLR